MWTNHVPEKYKMHSNVYTLIFMVCNTINWQTNKLKAKNCLVVNRDWVGYETPMILSAV